MGSQQRFHYIGNNNKMLNNLTFTLIHLQVYKLFMKRQISHWMKLLILLAVLTPSQTYLCSAFCSPGSCTGYTSNDCTNCSTGWVSSGTSCIVDPASGYSLAAHSADVTGGGSIVSVTPSGSSGSCSALAYSGDYSCLDDFSIDLSLGIGVPHYSYQLSAWIVLLNSSSWRSGDNIIISDGTTTSTTSCDQYSGQESICNSESQTVYRIAWSATHINQTSTPISLTISTDITDSACQWGIKEVVVIAQICHSYCSNCYGSSETECYSCEPSYYLSGNTCGISCAQGQGTVSGSNVCIQCSPYCQICAQSTSNCSSCTTSGANEAFLEGSTCVQACSSGTYANNATHTCDGCVSPCATCNESAICFSCVTNFGLFNNSCYNPCPGTYFLQMGTCASCDAVCLSCDKVSDNCSACNTAAPNEAFLDTTNNSYTRCVLSCNASAFEDRTTHQCSTCDPACLTCDGAATNCTACPSPKYWFAFACYDTCPPGYINDVNNCSICDPLCSLCSQTVTNCSECNRVAPNVGYLLNNSCLVSCPNPYFQDNNTGVGPNLCSSCHSNCQSCLDATSTNCQSCAANYTLSGSTCDVNCLPGYGPSPTPQVCLACTYPCLTCNGTATNCSTCNSTTTTHFLYQSSTTQFDCVTNCPIGTYVNSSAQICSKCRTGCTECSNNSYCYSCNYTGGFAWINTTYLCYNPCPVNYYKENTTNCSRCRDQCRRCINDPWNCTECQSTGPYRSFLLNITCYAICPSPTFGNTTTNRCQSCHSYCAICYNSTKNDCLLCQNPYIKSGTTCDTACAARYGVTIDPLHCVACNDTCLTCAYILTNCSSCQVSGNFTAFLYNYSSSYSQCLMSCPSGFFQEGATNLCKPCNQNCTLCQSDADNCSACISGFFFLNNTCLSQCPKGYFINGSECSACNVRCLECQGNSTNCSSCKYQGPNISYWKNNSCLTNCGTGYFRYKASSTGPTLCVLCDNSCQQCSVQANNCTACAPSYYLYGSNTCVLICPLGFFEYVPTMTCNDSSLTSVLLTMSMYFSDASQSKIYIDMSFNHPLNTSSFPYTSFQSITFDQSFDSGMISYSYQWLDSYKYRITIKPTSYIFLYNCRVTVTTISMPNQSFYSANGIEFYYTVYQKSAFLVWNLMGGAHDSNSAAYQAIQAMSTTSNAIRNITTLPYLQQINKAGLVSLLFPGAQITSSIIVTDSVYSPQMYEGSRIWSNFIYFQVPAWQKDKEKTKYIGPSAQDKSSQVRMLNVDRKTWEAQPSLNWRFQRTGFSAIFLFDCYLQLFLIVFCWALVLLGSKLEQKCKWNIMPKIYPIFHALHEMMIFYLAMGLVIELIYFEATSFLKVISLALAVLSNAYLLVYTLYIYYSFMRYPMMQMGTKQYREITLKFGSFIRNIRHEEYQEYQNWSPKHLFRPYNYHLLSYYKKFLMILSIPLFKEYPSSLAGILIVLQIMEIIRFCKTWPYVSLKRNVFRLLLELLLLLFFATSLAQIILMAEIQKNNSQTIESAFVAFDTTGWIGMLSIFIFNVCCFLQLLVSMFQHACKSNREAIRQIRRDYYYDKIVKYQQSLQNNITNQELDRWVLKGDLNQKWIDDENGCNLPIRVTLQRYTINIIGDGFMIQLETITKAVMGQSAFESLAQKIRVQEQLKGTVTLNKQSAPHLYEIIWQVYHKYDPNFFSDFLTIKTVAKIDPERYAQGDRIHFSADCLSQVVTLSIPFDKKQTHQVSAPLDGFPLDEGLLRSVMEETISEPESL